MNPFFEQQWREAHTRLIAHMAESLQEQLPADLVARAEEEETVMIGGLVGTSAPRGPQPRSSPNGVHTPSVS